ncbi:SEFIR domain-containing protein [Paraliomyxa miuraensis]|uniref:SEFIR domain-containing protein n=1 Tax=Paraliomyxa miuraensis TaxID=376150 RepID=UPI00225A820C|nr:SEFIR domain-containing protein [Paraliomyxa miuraensis]MCX4243189.1 TIR domain-containing protein [Paraliomyxa miuraensis]
MSSSHPSVFVVFAQGSSALVQRVRALADRLRSDGIDVILDREVEDPPLEWTERQLQDCDRVLVVWTTADREALEHEHIAPHRRQYVWRGDDRELFLILFEEESEPDVVVSGLDDALWFRLPTDYDRLRDSVSVDDGAMASRAPASESWGERIKAAQHAGGLEARESRGPLWSHAPKPDVGLDDHLWETGFAGALDVLARRIPVITRGSTIIANGRVRHMHRPIPRCPDCDGPLQPALVQVRFDLAPDATAAQRIPGHRCSCGSQWPDPFAMRLAHATAFGLTGA